MIHLEIINPKQHNWKRSPSSELCFYLLLCPAQNLVGETRIALESALTAGCEDMRSAILLFIDEGFVPEL